MAATNLLFQSHPTLASMAPMAAILDGNSSSSSSSDAEEVYKQVGRSRVKKYRNRMKTKNKPYNSRKEMLKHREERKIRKENKKIKKKLLKQEQQKKNKKKFDGKNDSKDDDNNNDDNTDHDNKNNNKKEKKKNDNLDSLTLFMKYSSFHTNEEDE
tara:strand:- start:12 stop:479 length:468 start_codon:yes stop_codon:yes gene_type:complete